MHQAGYNSDKEYIGPKSDLEDIKKVLAQFYEGLSEHKLETLEHATASGFYLLEHGEYWDLEYTKARIGQHKPKGFSRSNRFDFKRIEVLGDHAFAVWDLFANVHRDKKQSDLYWLESGSFKKTTSGWKVHFLHSTRSTPS